MASIAAVIETGYLLNILQDFQLVLDDD